MVSRLLDQGPHTVTVYLEETTTDSYGNEVKRPSSTGVVVKGCLLTPLAASTDAVSALSTAQGQRADMTFRFRARRAPLGSWSRVVWNDGTRERRLTVLSGPLNYDYSSATAHVAATLHEEH